VEENIMGIDVTGLGSLFDLISKALDKIFPDQNAASAAKLEMFKLQQAGAFREMEQQFELAKKQIDVNVEEAKSSSLFVSGWRPAIGWVCVAAYAFNYLVLPLANFAAHAAQIKADIVALDTGELTTLLFGMLGIGTLRTYEKLKGVTK
jgi:hypothetical protein